MQDSSPFQYVDIDQLFESKTNPRQTFDQAKLEELAASVAKHGLIQPVVVRPKDGGFEVVAGARRYRASLLAEKFSIPAHIKELTDAEAIEWQLIENSQRVDVHPYEEAQGFQRLLDVPGYDVAAIRPASRSLRPRRDSSKQPTGLPHRGRTSFRPEEAQGHKAEEASRES